MKDTKLTFEELIKHYIHNYQQHRETKMTMRRLLNQFESDMGDKEISRNVLHETMVVTNKWYYNDLRLKLIGAAELKTRYRDEILATPMGARRFKQALKRHNRLNSLMVESTRLPLDKAIEEFLLINTKHREEKVYTKNIYQDNIRTGHWKPFQIAGYENAVELRLTLGKIKSNLRERIYSFPNGKSILKAALKTYNRMIDSKPIIPVAPHVEVVKPITKSLQDETDEMLLERFIKRRGRRNIRYTIQTKPKASNQNV